MISVLPASGEEKRAFLAQEPEALELFILREGETERGRTGVSLRHGSLWIVLFETEKGTAENRRFWADTLLRAAASCAANHGAYRLCCSLPTLEAFLRSEGFSREGNMWSLPTESIVKIKKNAAFSANTACQESADRL